MLDKAALTEASASVVFAQSTRRAHARRSPKGGRQRERDIRTALDRLAAAMLPLRREIARFPYQAQTETAEIARNAVRAASQAMQRERRKLWKMQRHKPGIV